MKRVVMDTNALVSFVTTRNPEQQARIAPLFEDAAGARRELLCPQIVLAEFAYVMQRVYNVKAIEISAIMRDFIALPGVKVVHELDFAIFFALWPDPVREYGDAVVAAVARSHKGARIATFDGKFASVLRRLEIPLLFS